MNIYVCIKQVPDTTTRIRLRDDGDGIDESDIKWIISPHDELAIEEALQVRERTPESTVTALTAGPARADDALRMALAMGVDRAVRLDLPGDADPAMNAKALAAAIGKVGPADIVFTGKEAIDDGAAQVGHLLAFHLGLPAVTAVNRVEYGDGKILCRRDAGGGNLETIEAPLPAVVAAQVGLNQPRYATAFNIIKARKKPIDTMAMTDLGVSESDRKTRLIHFHLPPPKQPCRFIDGPPADQARELIRVLREEIKAI